MSKSILAAAALATFTLLPLTTGTPAQATTACPSTTSCITRGAPGPIIGAGLPLLAAGGIGYGVYWLVKRRRRKSEI
jgi:hypothetical protein